MDRDFSARSYGYLRTRRVAWEECNYGDSSSLFPLGSFEGGVGAPFVPLISFGRRHLLARTAFFCFPSCKPCYKGRSRPYTWQVHFAFISSSFCALEINSRAPFASDTFTFAYGVRNVRTNEKLALFSELKVAEGILRDIWDDFRGEVPPTIGPYAFRNDGAIEPIVHL